MVDINLYPWREKRAQFEMFVVKKTLVISVTITVLAVLAAHAVMVMKIQALQSTEAGLQETLSTYHQEKIQPDEIKQAPVEADAQPPITHKLMQAISGMVSGQLCLTSIERVKNRLVFAGEVASVRALMDYLQHWEVDGIFSDIQLVSMHELIDQAGWDFQFHANLATNAEAVAHDTV